MTKQVNTSSLLFAVIAPMATLWANLDPFYPNLGGGSLMMSICKILCWFYIGAVLGRKCAMLAKARKIVLVVAGLLAMVAAGRIFYMNWMTYNNLYDMAFAMSGFVLAGYRPEWSMSKSVLSFLLALLLMVSLWFLGWSWQGRDILIFMKGAFKTLLNIAELAFVVSFYVLSVNDKVQSFLHRPYITKACVGLSILLTLATFGTWSADYYNYIVSYNRNLLIRNPIAIYAIFQILSWPLDEFGKFISNIISKTTSHRDR